ncbi:MAG: Holliday junction resolvase RecU [Clostridiales bacterium]|jgi:recombination protein U|nr:Holliday junction resolvase RecU [Clostridiales bacterium]
MGYWNTRGLRGSLLEEMLNLTNDRYRQRGLAVIQKIPTPITPVQVDNSDRIISKAYFGEKSTVDYIGVAQGTALCFDAKQTDRTSLPMQNIHSHQMDFMAAFEKQGGVSFLLVNFTADDAFYFLPFADLERRWNAVRVGGRKSIPRDDFQKEYRVESGNGFPLHYLEALNVYLGKANAK